MLHLFSGHVHEFILPIADWGPLVRLPMWMPECIRFCTTHIVHLGCDLWVAGGIMRTLVDSPMYLFWGDGDAAQQLLRGYQLFKHWASQLGISILGYILFHPILEHDLKGLLPSGDMLCICTLTTTPCPPHGSLGTHRGSSVRRNFDPLCIRTQSCRQRHGMPPGYNVIFIWTHAYIKATWLACPSSHWPTWHSRHWGSSCGAMAGRCPIWVRGWDARWPGASADENLCDARLWSCAPRRWPCPRSTCVTREFISVLASEFMGRQCPIRPCPWTISCDCCH